MFKIDELLIATGGVLIYGSKTLFVKGISIDSRTIRPGQAFVAIKGKNFDGHDFIGKAIDKGARVVIVNSSELAVHSEIEKKAAFIAVKDTVKALGDIARYRRKRFNIPVIAVTGSSGKTTLKEMLSWVLSGKFKVLKNIGTENNHIGLPMTLLKLDSTYDLAVLEIGTNHFGEVDYLAGICQPNIGIITNIGPAHLEYFKNLRGVFKEKYALIRHLRKPQVAVLNVDNALLKRQILRRDNSRFILGVGIKNRSDFFASDIKNLPGRLAFLVNKKYRFTLKTLGYYNIYNALAAIAVARLFGMKYKDIARRMNSFNFPQGRLKLRESDNICFIDDTYNSNPFSLEQALEALASLKVKGRKIFVMGDMLELGKKEALFHRQAGRKAAKVCDAFIAVGRLSGLAAQAAKDSGFDTKNIFTCRNSQEAREVLFNKIAPDRDDVVLVKGSRRMRMEEVFKN
jgi:UDP-N-acetylmuramoyl-tripeptide--D-alanyl-D-alanine ligase